MPGSFAVDELDQQLVHALQLAPRASWQFLGTLLDVDPATLGRRWRRLRDAGAARVTALLPATAARDFTMAFVEVRCAPSQVIAVARELAGDPRVQTIYTCAGPYDLFLAVYTSALDALGAMVGERVGRLPGVVSTRTHVVTEVLIPGAGWELRALSPAQRAELLAGAEQHPGTAESGTLTRADQEIFGELTRDGRISYRDLGDRLGVSLSTARRRLNRLLQSGAIALRCDIAKDAFGWPVSVCLWVETDGAPDAAIEAIRRDVPEIRMCTAITGTRDLVFILWLHRLADIRRVERRIRTHLPDIHVAERTAHLKMVKLVGHTLDTQGRAHELVPVNVFTPPEPIPRG